MLTVPEPPLVAALQAQGLPVPEVGQDLVVGNETIGTAELSWSGLRVAIVDGAEGSLEVPGWVLVQASDPTLVSRLQEVAAERSDALEARVG